MIYMVDANDVGRVPRALGPRGEAFLFETGGTAIHEKSALLLLLLLLSVRQPT